MKKISLLFFVSLLVFVLAACNETTTGSQLNNAKDDDELYVTRGVTNDKILIGNISPHTGPIAESGTARYGTEAYFNYINENGGVHGRQLELISYDDQYQPSQTVQVAPRLVEEDEVFLLLSNQGTANNFAVKDYYEENKVVSFLINTGAPDFTATKNPYWLGTGLTVYNIEAEILLEYAINEIGAKKIAVVYQNDDFGNVGFDAVKKAIGKYEGAEIIAEVPYVTGNEDFSSQAVKIKDSNPDAVLSFSLSGPTASLKKSMYDLGIDVPFLVTGLGGNNTNQFELAGAEAWEGTISSTPYFNPTSAPDDPQMKVYAEQLAKDFPDLPIDGFAQSGWASAQVLVEALERAGEDLTMEKFVEAVYTLEDWDGSMYASVSFSKENHYGLTSVYITEAKDGKITPITGKITYDPETGEISSE
ncbi:ABC transporter substrate-binding protein [Oceanobacillus piezotolerans]|uniref:ABC transporter substrate-binding protein n=1 Tax=Oceanobacillus piezotolerans TaxID=2448030 RepID=UPI00131412B2|nr:ABC transporter substrate-binding protein [Oceanobacillus piezotolerans]